MQSGYDSLIALPGVGVSMADTLYESGFYSAEEISTAAPEDLIQVRGIGEEKARKLIDAAKDAIAAAEQAEDRDAEPVPDEVTDESDHQSVQESESTAEQSQQLPAAETKSNSEEGNALSPADSESDQTETENP